VKSACSLRTVPGRQAEPHFCPALRDEDGRCHITFLNKATVTLSFNPYSPFLFWEIARALERNIRVTLYCTITFRNYALHS
jgi:hypothetical protein